MITTTTPLAPFIVAPEADTRPVTAETLQAWISDSVRNAHDQALMMRAMQTGPQMEEQKAWWNLYAIGPFQTMDKPAPFLPHEIIKAAETAYVVTVLVLNDFLTLPTGGTPADLLSSFSLPYEINFQAGNLSTCTLEPAGLNGVHSGAGYRLIPGVNFYVDVLEFSAAQTGLYELNISARIRGATRPLVDSAQFTRTAQSVIEIQPELFLNPAPGLPDDLPIQFMVYS
jgi:hypothetical protein